MSEQPPPTAIEALTTIIMPVAQRFSDAGRRLYLVGGVVRDLLIAGDGHFDTAANDIDLTTDAHPSEIKRLLSPVADDIWTQGERFGTIGANVSGHQMEITTHRAEAYDPESRKPVVTFGSDLHEDLSRRDFTINAAAIEVPSGELHDPHGGLADLRNGVLRTPLSPSVSFGDDPLRMMRAARFLSRFDIAPVDEMVEATIALADRLQIVSVERVADELERLLQISDPRPGLLFLQQTGLLRQIIPEFFGSGPGEPTPEQIVLALDLAAAPGSTLVRRAGLLWPAGSQAQTVLSRLRYSNEERSRTVKLLTAVTGALDGPIDDAAVRRVAAKVGAHQLDSVCELLTNLRDSTPEAQTMLQAVERVRSQEDLSDLDSPLSGRRVMELLDLAPGPDIGHAQRHLREIRIVEGPIDHQQAERALLVWWNSRS